MAATTVIKLGFGAVLLSFIVVFAFILAMSTLQRLVRVVRRNRRIEAGRHAARPVPGLERSRRR